MLNTSLYTNLPHNFSEFWFPLLCVQSRQVWVCQVLELGISRKKSAFINSKGGSKQIILDGLVNYVYSEDACNILTRGSHHRNPCYPDNSKPMRGDSVRTFHSPLNIWSRVRACELKISSHTWPCKCIWKIVTVYKNWLKQVVEQFAWRFINLLLLFGRRRNCLKSGRNQS